MHGAKAGKTCLARLFILRYISFYFFDYIYQIILNYSVYGV